MERKIIVKLICTSALDTHLKCGNIWTLDETDELYKNIVREGMNT